MFRYILTLFLLLLSRAPALAEYFVIDQFDIRIRIDESGYFEVTETIDVTFSQPRHGIYRVIPYRYRIDGEKYDIRLYDISVKGREFKRKRQHGNLRIRIGDPDEYVEGKQRYIIRYKVKGWLFEENHTEFYWNLTGNEWEVPIEDITFEIELPESVALHADDYQVFTGYAGQRGSDAEASWNGTVLSGRSTRPFETGEGLTVAIRLLPNLIDRPSEFENFMHHYGLLGIPAALLVLLGWLFVRIGRDEPFVKMARYYPPEGLPPAEAGAFIDDKTDNRDIISLIPYWGGQGYLKISEVEEEKLFGLLSSTDFEFSKVEGLPAGRPNYEYTVFNRLFREGDTVRISDLKKKFHTTMDSARKQIGRAVRNRQLHTSQSRMAWGALPVAAMVFAGLTFFFLARDQHAAGAGMGVVALAAFFLRRPMLKKNKEGMELYRQLYGFRMFVDKADRPRIEQLLKDDPAYFEKTLPFAIAFGMAKTWATNFEGLFTEPPRWYIGSHAHGNSFHSFASSFDSGMQEVQSAFSSSPGGSGSGGSGGGFGGGGGGSW